jgi:4'-phosphopantetheinyl transferase
VIGTSNAVIASNEIHFWIRSASPSDEEYRALPAKERARADGIVPPEKRAQFIAGRALLRRVLGTALGVEPEDVPIVLGENGRPCLTRDESLDFNISHSDGLVLLAVASHTRLAVDVEATRPGRAYGPIAERFFSAGERELLAAAPEAQRSRAFYDIWTCKEAYIKVHGLGVLSHMKRISVSPATHRIVCGVEGDVPERWRLDTLDVSRRHRASVCWETRARDDWRFRVHDQRGVSGA